jgi:hypothetical protein
MKNKIIIFRFAAILLFVGSYQVAVCQDAAPPAEPNRSSIFGVYSGTTPCGSFVRQMLAIPNTACEKIKWNLTLYQPVNGIGSYTLKFSYGMQANGSAGFTGGGQAAEIRGTWTISKGTKTDPDAIVYELNLGKSRAQLLLVKIDENVLHLLYMDRNLLIGGASWGYALNKVRNR